MRSSPPIPIPRTVPLLPLHDKVLLPGVVTRMQVTRRDSIPLFEKILRSFDSRELNKCILGAFPVCVPVSKVSPKGDTRNSKNELITPGSSPVYPAVGGEEGQGQVVRSGGVVDAADIHLTGCAVRLVKLERVVGGFTVVLEGKQLSLCAQTRHWTISRYLQCFHLDG